MYSYAITFHSVRLVGSIIFLKYFLMHFDAQNWFHLGGHMGGGIWRRHWLQQESWISRVQDESVVFMLNHFTISYLVSLHRHIQLRSSTRSCKQNSRSYSNIDISSFREIHISNLCKNNNKIRITTLVQNYNMRSKYGCKFIVTSFKY